MEGGAGTAMEVLVQNLINVSKEEICLIRGLDKEAEQLKMSLLTIQGYLNEAEKKYITQESVKRWLDQLEEVAFDADNVLDEFNYHALHKKVKATKTMMNNALSCFSSSHHTLRPHHMAHRIKEINASFNSITRRAADLNLQSTFVDASASASVPDFAFETDAYALDPIFIGRDDDVPRLVEALTGRPEEWISILAVVGMGGMGKTTLTRKVFNHHEMKTRFGFHSWVYVSRTFSPRLIFKKFLASLPDEDKTRKENGNEPISSEGIPLKLQKSFKAKTDETETRQAILEKLQQALKNKTFLLVLDDVWNEDIMKWEDFIDSLSGVTSTNGNCIIITTRSTEVASIVNPLQTHCLNGLSDDDCWSIIKAKVSEMGKLIPLEFETIGRKIARKCHGLPLAAKVVGGVLRRKSEQEWLSIEQKWLSDVDGDYISRILKLSYDNLSSAALKKCFAYCSIFPKGHRMVKQELIELWMAERFLQPDERNDMESVGDKFVNVLLHNSLLQIAPRNYDDEEICVMHDLVHDLASSVLGSLKVRYLWHGDESSRIPKDSVKHLRTLFLEGEVSEFRLSDFKCLHVLNFGSGSHVVTQLSSSSISKLIHLRRLDISKTRIKYLPDSIGELHHLQTLRAYTWSLKELPRMVKYLISLRHLYIYDDVKLPPKIGRLTSLQTLTHFTVGHENGYQIEELGSLKNLKGKLKIFNLENVKEKEEAKKANLFQNSNLLELSFIWSYGRDEIHINEEKVLEGLQPHSNLKKLKIKGFRGKKFPSWIMKMAVADEAQGFWLLVKITLDECDECEEIPTLGLLPNLKHLKLRKLRKVKSLNSSFYGIGVGQETISVFPVLERLELHFMFELREWADVEFPESRLNEVKVFPSLLYLTIYNCEQLRSIPGHSFRSLKELGIYWLPELECLPDGLFRNNQNLSKLTISEFPKLREFPDGLGTLCSLEELTIKICRNLKSIGNPIGQSQGTLRRLRIEGCKELMDLPHELVESWAPSLEFVWLRRLNSLNNLPKLIECMAKSSRLTMLKISGVPKFMVTRTIESWQLHSLQRLEIDGSVEWSRESSVGIKETIDGILQGCNPHSLVQLDLTGLEIWECLPESIQNLTGLSRLTLRNFGIEKLPEWFGNLSSLESLYIIECKKLRCLFGNDTLGRLTKLREISVYNCPELRIDSKWHRNNNLSIYVDGNKYPLHGIIKLHNPS